MLRTHLSPNYNDRAAGMKPSYIILHFTNMLTAEEGEARLCDPAAEVSAHYLIARNHGDVVQLVADEHRAWHAGQSYWRGQTDLNSLSIGIELDALRGQDFTFAQIDALLILLRELNDRFSIPAANFLGHSDIAPLRKDDPGPLFPWKRLADNGFGLWPVPKKEDYEPLQAGERRRLLALIGYDCREDETAAAAEIAFLCHYHPENWDKGFNAESDARLRAMVRMVG